MNNIISFNEYIKDRQSERIADKVMERHHPISECLVTIEEIERETDRLIKEEEGAECLRRR